MDRKIDQSKLITALLVLLLAVGAALLYWFYFLKPSFAEINELRDEIVALNEEIVLLDEKLAQKAFIEQQWDDLSESEPLLRTRIPGRDDLPQVLESLEKLVRASSLELIALNAGELVEGDRYRTVPVSLQLSGNRSKLFSFLKKLERFPHMTLIGQSGIEKGEGGHRLSVNFNLILISEGQVEEVGSDEEGSEEEQV